MNPRRLVIPLVVSTPLPVRMVGPECGVLVAPLWRAGGKASCRDAPPSCRRTKSRGRTRAQGKIKGRGTGARRKPCLHMGKGGTHLEWQRAVRSAKLALALGKACAPFAGLRPT